MNFSLEFENRCRHELMQREAERRRELERQALEAKRQQERGDDAAKPLPRAG